MLAAIIGKINFGKRFDASWQSLGTVSRTSGLANLDSIIAKYSSKLTPGTGASVGITSSLTNFLRY